SCYAGVTAGVTDVHCRGTTLDFMVGITRNSNSTRRRDSIPSNPVPDTCVVDLSAANVRRSDVALDEDVDLFLVCPDSRRHDDLETPPLLEVGVESFDLIEH